MSRAVSAKSAAELLGVSEPSKNARDRLIDTAIDLFYRNGFHAVGLDLIIDETGVTKTTFYKHFESKDDLIIAALKKRDEWECGAWQRAVKQIAGDDPSGQLLAYFDVLDQWFNAPDFLGCLFINAAAEFADPRDPIHKEAAAHKVKARNQFRDLAKQAGASDPETFADLYTAVFEGTLILRHVHHRNDAARVARPMIEQLVNQHLGRRAS
jgi:AcrR family transcriptional regulator